jgi:2-oxo-4-hydroxy-4-carboxy--5-ureidoimidazoline (OHCU) decarboxylase
MPATIWGLQAVFERSAVLLSRLIPQVEPGDTPQGILERARAIIAQLDERERIATLNAHPRIGDDVRALSELSMREQGDDRDDATMRELAELNDAYEKKFGFRFVVFVHGRSKREIVPVLRERLQRRREDELATGIDAFLAISLDRLQREQDGIRRAMDVDS